MRPHKLGLTVIAALVAAVSTPLSLNFPVPLRMPAALAQSPEARKAEADRLLEQGIQQYGTNQFQAAIQSWQQALSIYRVIGNRNGEASSLNNLGNAYRSLGQYAKAIEFYQQSLAMFREIGDRNGEANSLMGLGNAYRSLGQYAKAIEFYQQSLAMFREIGDRKGETGSLNNLGVTYGNLGQYAKGIEFNQQSLAIAREIGDRYEEALSLGNLGTAYNNLGQYAKAIEFYQQSLAIAREIGDRKHETGSLMGLGTAYNYLGQYAKAIEFSQQSLTIAREIGARNGTGSLMNLGTAYLNLGQYAKAIEFYQQSLVIAREIGDRYEEASSLGNLGNAYHYLGQYAKAIEFHQQSLVIFREIGNRNDEARSLGNLGTAYNSLGQYAKALEFNQQSLVLFREIGDRLGEGKSLSSLGAAFLLSGKLAEAEITLRDGIKIWESIRADLGNNDANKISIFEEQASTYRWLQQALILQNKINDGLEISERGRARAFVELLAQKFSNQSSAASSNQPASTLIHPPSIIQIQQIAKQQNATLVEYSIISNIVSNNEELYIWVIKPTGEIAFRRVDLKSLNTSLQDLVTRSRDTMEVRGLPIVGTRPRPGVPQKQEENLTQQLQKLHQILIEPIADQLPTDPNAKVIFIPQQSLFLVPFAALQDKAGKYLIEKHTILTAPSIQVLEFTRQQREKVRNLSLKDSLIVGNPTMPSVPPAPGEPPQRLSPLDGAENEAMEIARLLNAAAMTGNQATKAAVLQKLPGARIIHLATHGLLDDFGDGLPGAIALAPANGDSGLLTTREILDLKFNAELVVLSACNTGSGDITGDGVVGLSRALIYAGVSSLVVSLWAVPDSPTEALMTEFYRQLQQRPNKATALRQAMLITLKQHPNPRAWAAFTLIGEAE